MSSTDADITIEDLEELMNACIDGVVASSTSGWMRRSQVHGEKIEQICDKLINAIIEGHITNISYDDLFRLLDKVLLNLNAPNNAAYTDLKDKVQKIVRKAISGLAIRLISYMHEKIPQTKNKREYDNIKQQLFERTQAYILAIRGDPEKINHHRVDRSAFIVNNAQGISTALAYLFQYASVHGFTKDQAVNVSAHVSFFNLLYQRYCREEGVKVDRNLLIDESLHNYAEARARGERVRLEPTTINNGIYNSTALTFERLCAGSKKITEEIPQALMHILDLVSSKLTQKKKGASAINIGDYIVARQCVCIATAYLGIYYADSKIQREIIDPLVDKHIKKGKGCDFEFLCYIAPEQILAHVQARLSNAMKGTNKERINAQQLEKSVLKIMKHIYYDNGQTYATLHKKQMASPQEEEDKDEEQPTLASLMARAREKNACCYC